MVMFSSNKPVGGVKWHLLWWLFWGVIIVLGLVLGGWQWQRAEEKRAYLASLANAPVLAMPHREPPEGAKVHLRGYFLSQATRFLDNRVKDGRIGVAVLTPLVDEQGQWWLIERGFVATGPLRREPSVETPSGRVELSGQWQVAGNGAPLFGPNQEGRRLQRIELSAWQGMPRFAYAGWLHQTDGQGAFEPWWSPSVMPPSRHVGYAIQWWALAIAAMATMWFGRRHLASRLPLKEVPCESDG